MGFAKRSNSTIMVPTSNATVWKKEKHGKSHGCSNHPVIAVSLPACDVTEKNIYDFLHVAQPATRESMFYGLSTGESSFIHFLFKGSTSPSHIRRAPPSSREMEEPQALAQMSPQRLQQVGGRAEAERL